MRASLLALVLAAGCVAKPQPPRAPAPEVCHDLGPPPGVYPVEFAGPPACPAPFTRCLDRDAAAALLHNVWALQHYAVRAWTLCGPRDAGAGD